MRDFRKLEIWELGMDIAQDVYTISKSFPDSEKYGLTSQMRRASISIPSNIAEGCSRNSNKEFVRFIEISIGSSFEIETQTLFAKRNGLLDDSPANGLIEKLHLFQRKSNSFRKILLS